MSAVYHLSVISLSIIYRPIYLPTFLPVYLPTYSVPGTVQSPDVNDTGYLHGDARAHGRLCLRFTDVRWSLPWESALLQLSRGTDDLTTLSPPERGSHNWVRMHQLGAGQTQTPGPLLQTDSAGLSTRQRLLKMSERTEAATGCPPTRSTWPPLARRAATEQPKGSHVTAHEILSHQVSAPSC